MSKSNQKSLKQNLMEDYPSIKEVKKQSQQEEFENSDYRTLRESVWTSLKRELVRILNKTQYVIVPRFSASSNKDLRNWDLWGPLVFTMLLSYFISDSKSDDEMSQTFCLVFIMMWVGGTIVTLNSLLLGSKINVLQSMCVLGYCIFPVLIAAILLNYLHSILTIWIRIAIGGVAFLWSSTSSIAFMGDIVGQDKKMLAVYPIYLFYFSFCCYLLL